MAEFMLIAGAAIAGDVAWSRIINPWLDKHRKKSYFFEPKKKKENALQV